MVADVVVLTSLGLIAAWLLTTSRQRFAPATDDLVEQINQKLPQTQCAQCGYPGCRPYAEAIAAGEQINKCPPGGESTIEVLADFLGREVLPLDQSVGEATPPAVAVIQEHECIGCTLCIPACPVDAIIGAQGQMHTVLESACTGCDLCREPCPVDCIDLVVQDTTPVPVFPAVQTPCINCGDCAIACPKALQPQLLFWYREDTERARDLNLSDCIECRLCDRVCPSDIPLTNIFQVTKLIARREDNAKSAAQVAEARFIARESRQSNIATRVVKRPSANDRQALLDSLKESS